MFIATAVLMWAVLASAQSLTITTIAGLPGEAGSADGTGSSARFFFATAMVADPAGDLYVLDGGNYTVRKVTAAGVVTTIAGAAGVREYRDGTGTGAHFNQPRGLARDSVGNLYVGDWNPAGSGPTVRKISPGNVVTSYLPGVGAVSLAMDVNDYLLIGGSPLRAILAGSIVELGPWWLPPPGEPPPPPVGNFGAISALAIGRDRTIYVLDSANNEVRKITTAGVMTSLAGAAGVAGYADGSGASARFNAPTGIAVDSAGNVFVADWVNPVLRKITPSGVVTTVAGLVGAFVPGSFPDGVGSDARFAGLTALAIANDDTLYLGEIGAIRKATVALTPAKIVVPPRDLTVAAGERATFSVAANGYPAVTFQWQRLSAGSSSWISLTDNVVYTGTSLPALVINTVSPAMNGDQFRCVVTNSRGTGTSAPATLLVDPPVVVVPLRVTTLAGRAGVGGFADGAGGGARFNGPMGVAMGADGNVYVSDNIGNRVRKITSGGAVTTIAGSGAEGERPFRALTERAAGVSSWLEETASASGRSRDSFVAMTGLNSFVLSWEIPR